MDDLQFRELLQCLGLSWKGYRKVRGGVKKRIRRHMRQLGCRNVLEYLLALDKNNEEKRQCELMMTVSISRFFRDRKLWEVLEKEILPQLIEEQKEKVSAWSAGCACGEEVYSLKILWDRLGISIVHQPLLEITATDMNPDCLNRARSAAYPSSSLKELPLQLRSLYFQEDSDRDLYKAKTCLKNGILWKNHNLRSYPPGSDFHLVFLRNNLLTYYKNGFKKESFEKVVDCLSDGGILIIGIHEELPCKTSRLIHYGSFPYIFKKRA